MNRLVLAMVFSLGSAVSLMALAPLTYEEISLLLRMGEKSESIVGDAGRRKILRPLSLEQETALRLVGGSNALIAALKEPALLAQPADAAAYEAGLRKRQHLLPAQDMEPALPQKGSPAVTPLALLQSEPTPFAGPLISAHERQPVTLQLNSAFRLSELEQAKNKARAEKKALGFIMVWDQFFGKPISSNGTGSAAGLVHFYQAFNSTLVLVFVRHEDELGMVPEAVKKGFNGPDEGGFAPNMAVVDATATEFIVEIPLGGGAAGLSTREGVFQAGAARIAQWLATHPDAVRN